VKENGISLVELLIKAEFASSKAEAKRMIKAGSARVNDEKIIDEGALVTANYFDQDGKLKLSSGKKKHALVMLK
jgi:tyrosyl-tRNA synthetase